MKPSIAGWERKFAGAGYEFGTAPYAFLVREAPRIVMPGDVLESAFPAHALRSLIEYDAPLDEGPRHRGMSALVGLVAVAPCPDSGGGSRPPVRDARDLVRSTDQCATHSCQMEPPG